MSKEKKRLKYSIWSNLRFIFGNMWRWNPRATALTMLRAPFMVAVPMLGLFLSQRVIILLEAGADLNQVVANIGAICGATALCMVILNYLNGQNTRAETVNSSKYQNIIFKCMMDFDYEYNESPDGLSAAQKAVENCGSSQSGARKAIDTASAFVGNAIGILSYAAIIIALNPLIFLTICVTTGASYFLLKRITAWNRKHKDSWMPINRRRNYLADACKDLSPAKDIRLYNMAGWLREMMGTAYKQRAEWSRREETHAFGIDMLCALLSLIREGAAYGLLVYMMFQNNMPVGDFVLYFGVIGGFTAWFDGIVDNFSWFDRINVGFNEMREYLDYQGKSNKGAGADLPAGTFGVEFQNVSYAFSGTDTELFKDFNLKIRQGEKLAIVGLNGAGKTTLVKLLCGLYRPTSGAVLADGRPVDEYNIDEYYSLFSAVFQDITIMPMSVAKNITCQVEGYDEIRLREALRISGFDAVASKLAHGLDTYLVAGIYPDAVDLSGGEVQKLALARALYRGGRFLILDEPTAALDPIAENNVYQQYNAISQGKTSVFISHRLASTRFCDRIIFLENGKIVEEGTHDQLIAQKGKYYQLYEVQSHYYREEEAV